MPNRPAAGKISRLSLASNVTGRLCGSMPMITCSAMRDKSPGRAWILSLRFDEAGSPGRSRRASGPDGRQHVRARRATCQPVWGHGAYSGHDSPWECGWAVRH